MWQQCSGLQQDEATTTTATESREHAHGLPAQLTIQPPCCCSCPLQNSVTGWRHPNRGQSNCRLRPPIFWLSLQANTCRPVPTTYCSLARSISGGGTCSGAVACEVHGGYG